jgi:membrane protein involved in colicin uptake
MFNFLINFILAHKKAFFFAVILHFVALSIVIFSKITPFEAPKIKNKKQEIIKAVSVDLDLVKKEKQRLVNIKKAKQIAKEQEIKQHNNTLKNLKTKQKEAETKRLQAINDKKKADLEIKKAKKAKKEALKEKKLLRKQKKKH